MFKQPDKQKPRKYNTSLFDKYHIPQQNISENIKTQLFSLVNDGDYNKIKNFMLENSTNLNIKTDDGESLIHLIINSPNPSLTEINRLDMLKFLHLNGAPIDTFNNENFTPLLLAIKKQYFLIVKYLLKNDANVNNVTNQNFNAIHLATTGTKMIQEPTKIKEQPKDINLLHLKKISLKILDIINNNTDYNQYITHIVETLKKYPELYYNDYENFKELYNQNIKNILNQSNLKDDEKNNAIQKLFTQFISKVSNSLNTKLYNTFKKIDIENDIILNKITVDIQNLKDNIIKNIPINYNNIKDYLDEINNMNVILNSVDIKEYENINLENKEPVNLKQSRDNNIYDEYNILIHNFISEVDYSLQRIINIINNEDFLNDLYTIAEETIKLITTVNQIGIHILFIYKIVKDYNIDDLNSLLYNFFNNLIKIQHDINLIIEYINKHSAKNIILNYLYLNLNETRVDKDSFKNIFYNSFQKINIFPNLFELYSLTQNKFVINYFYDNYFIKLNKITFNKYIFEYVPIPPPPKVNPGAPPGASQAPPQAPPQVRRQFNINAPEFNPYQINPPIAPQQAIPQGIQQAIPQGIVDQQAIVDQQDNSDNESVASLFNPFQNDSDDFDYGPEIFFGGSKRLKPRDIKLGFLVTENNEYLNDEEKGLIGLIEEDNRLISKGAYPCVNTYLDEHFYLIKIKLIRNILDILKTVEYEELINNFKTYLQTIYNTEENIINNLINITITNLINEIIINSIQKTINKVSIMVIKSITKEKRGGYMVGGVGEYKEEEDRDKISSRKESKDDNTEEKDKALIKSILKTIVEHMKPELSFDFTKLFKIITKNFKTATQNDIQKLLYTNLSFEEKNITSHELININTNSNMITENSHLTINLELLELLLETGASPNIIDNIEKTPLYYAIDIQYPKLVKLLINNGAFITGNKLVNPYDYLISKLEFIDFKSFGKNLTNLLKDDLEFIPKNLDIILPQILLMYNETLWKNTKKSLNEIELLKLLDNYIKTTNEKLPILSNLSKNDINQILNKNSKINVLREEKENLELEKDELLLNINLLKTKITSYLSHNKDKTKIINLENKINDLNDQYKNISKQILNISNNIKIIKSVEKRKLNNLLNDSFINYDTLFNDYIDYNYEYNELWKQYIFDNKSLLNVHNIPYVIEYLEKDLLKNKDQINKQTLEIILNYYKNINYTYDTEHTVHVLKTTLCYNLYLTILRSITEEIINTNSEKNINSKLENLEDNLKNLRNYILEQLPYEIINKNYNLDKILDMLIIEPIISISKESKVYKYFESELFEYYEKLFEDTINKINIMINNYKNYLQLKERNFEILYILQ